MALRSVVGVCAALAVAASAGLVAPVARPGSAAAAPKSAVSSPAAPRQREAWVVVPGLDSDGDGRRDRVHVVYSLPARRTGRVPVVVEASPYLSGYHDVRNHEVDRDLYVPREVGGFVGFSSSYRDLLQPQGYAYVFAESVGTGGSTGCPTTGGPAETEGMAAVVAWLTGDGRALDARGHTVRASWSSGRVGMIGVSYNGTLANAVASTGIDGLDAIVAVSAISSWYDYYRSQGAVRAPGGYQGEDADVLARFVLTRRHPRTCASEVASLARRQDRRTGDLNRFWARRDYRDDAADVHAAVLTLHGLGDWNVMSDQAGRELRALSRAGVPHAAWWHRGGHGDPLIDSDRRWRHEVLDWFDRWLTGAHNGVVGRPGSVVADGRGHYWTSPRWPAPRARDVTLHLQRGGRTAGSLTLRSSDGGVERLTDDAAYGLDQLSRRHRSPHRLLYRSAPLSSPLSLSGLGSVSVAVAFDAEASNLSVGLADIAPGGGVRVISEGWADPQNAGAGRSGRALRPGHVYSLDVDLDLVLQHRVGAGHRLALVVAASDHDFTLRPPPGTRLRVHLSGSTLHLPVVGGPPAWRSATRR